MVSSESEGSLRYKDFKTLRQDLKDLRSKERDNPEELTNNDYIRLIDSAISESDIKEAHRIIPAILGNRDPSDYPFLLWLIRTTDFSKVKNPIAYLNSFFMDNQQSFEKRTQFQEYMGILQKSKAAKAAREFEKVMSDAY